MFCTTVAKIMSPLDIHEGTVLIREGSPQDVFYLVEAGCLVSVLRHRVFLAQCSNSILCTDTHNKRFRLELRKFRIASRRLILIQSGPPQRECHRLCVSLLTQISNSTLAPIIENYSDRAFCTWLASRTTMLHMQRLLQERVVANATPPRVTSFEHSASIQLSARSLFLC